MKRPIGVIFSCIILGMLALFQLGGALVIAILGVVMRRGLPATAAAQATPAPSPDIMAGIFFVMAFFAVALGLWSAVTVGGLAKLRNWARISMIVLSVCVAGFSLLAILGTVVAMFAATRTPPPPNLPANMMQLVFAFYLFLYVILLAIAVWWLVYFNQRRTRAYFLPNYATDPTLPYGLVPPPPPPDSALASLLARVPIPITIMASLFLIGSPMCLLCVLIPLPALFLGFIIPRPASILLYLVFAVTSAACGIGLFRLENWARILTYAYMALGLINFVFLLTPGGQHRYAAYNQAVAASMHVGGTPAPNPLNTPALLISMLVFMVILFGLQVWALERSRYLFLKQPPPQPDPLKTPLVF